MGFQEKFKQLRNQRGMTQADVAGLLDPPYTAQAVYNWETKGNVPKIAVVRQLAAIFGVSVAELLDEVELPQDARRPLPSTATAPVLQLGFVHAGDPEEALSEPIVMQIPADVAERHPRAYLLEVRGDCMNLAYHEGCMVLVDPDMVPRNGLAVVAEYMGDTVLRRYHRFTDTLILSADSTSPHPDIVVRGEMDVRCLGTVVWYQAREDER